MIQRIQTLWLLLAAVCMGLLAILPVYGGELPLQAGSRDFLATQNYLLLITAAVVTIFPVVAVFQYKSRTTQKKLIWVSLLLNIIFLGLVWMEVTQYSTAQAFQRESYKLGAVLPLVSIVFLILALGGIRRDEKLLKSADRLR